MSPRQIIVLVIAAIAAIGALLVIRGMGARRAEPEAAQAVSGVQVLVAARAIGQGAALTPSDIAVATFPEAAVSPVFINISAQPSAQSDFVGAVTLRSFSPGEPITSSSVVQAEGRGFMAAQLKPGYRAVAIEIEANTAAGNYIQPNDHVDVIMTAREGSDMGGVVSEIVLRDIRVLAIGDRTDTQTAGERPEQIAADTAVLEMTPDEARSLALANEMGDISLALRGPQAETVGMHSGERNANFGGGHGGVLVHAFGAVSGGDR